MQMIMPLLWYDNQAEQAAKFTLLGLAQGEAEPV